MQDSARGIVVKRSMHIAKFIFRTKSTTSRTNAQETNSVRFLGLFGTSPLYKFRQASQKSHDGKASFYFAVEHLYRRLFLCPKTARAQFRKNLANLSHGGEGYFVHSCRLLHDVTILRRRRLQKWDPLMVLVHLRKPPYFPSLRIRIMILQES